LKFGALSPTFNAAKEEEVNKKNTINDITLTDL
jgi:hypothetical protein